MKNNLKIIGKEMKKKYWFSIILLLMLFVNLINVKNKPTNTDGANIMVGDSNLYIVCDGTTKIFWADSNDFTGSFMIHISNCNNRHLIDSVITNVGFPEKVIGLIFNGNLPDSLPNEFCNFVNLNYFNMPFSTIKFFPECVSEFQNLHRIDMSFYEGATLPRNIELFENLWFLTLSSSNKLEPKPLFQVISRMRNLYQLYLNNYHASIDTLPKEMGNLTKLTTLYMPYTKVKYYPKN